MKNYSSERNIQIMVALLKAYRIKKVIASPGTTNLNFVVSLQNDSWFEIYSAVDERSAAYMACGMADVSGEPVVITCTEATASRNYMPGLTEAFYRQLPVLAITGSRGNALAGNYIPQSIDRSSVPKDICKISVELPPVFNENDYKYCELTANKALLELTRHGGGPVHINLCTEYQTNFDCKELPKVRKICRYNLTSEFPIIDNNLKIAIQVGSHKIMSHEDISLIDEFCEKYDAVVFYDHTSRYNGKYGVMSSLLGAQREMDKTEFMPDLMISIGGVLGGNYPIASSVLWRVNDDGELRDRNKNLKCVFEMSEKDFFSYYVGIPTTRIHNTYYRDNLKLQYKKLIKRMPELPFSNAWVAQYSSRKIPHNSYVYLGILNTLRVWNYFELPEDVISISNVGGFGIDGGISSALGAALVLKNQICYSIVGDLGFFYDLNTLGNRHISSNFRILIINNGKGVEFRISDNIGSSFSDHEAEQYFAAGGHFGSKSRYLVKNYAENLGFRYLSADCKDEFIEKSEIFFSETSYDMPMIFEVFINSKDDCDAHDLLRQIYAPDGLSYAVKGKIKSMLGEKLVSQIKGFLHQK